MLKEDSFYFIFLNTKTRHDMLKAKKTGFAAFFWNTKARKNGLEEGGICCTYLTPRHDTICFKKTVFAAFFFSQLMCLLIYMRKSLS